MSVFNAHHERHEFSVLRTLAVAGMLTGAFLLAETGAPQTATISDALPGVATPVPTAAATVFPEPREVQWEGLVTRTLAGGRGVEVKSVEAEGGWFFAYDDNGISASASEGPVLVRGRWLGISCEYGRCAPEVDIEEIRSVPVTKG